MTALLLQHTSSVEDLAVRIQHLVGERQSLRAAAATRETLESNRREICRLQRELSFRDCALPEGSLLGERGAGYRQFLQILDGGRISIAAMGLGLAQGAYDLAAAYARERKQFGQPIAKFQAIQFKLADMATEIEAGRGLVYRAAWLKDQGRPFAQAAAMAKLFTGELAHRVANHALQIHGGYGFMDEYAISRLYRDQKVLEIGEGTNEVQRMVIAKHLGL